MAKRLTTFSKLLITLVILIPMFFGFKYVFEKIYISSGHDNLSYDMSKKIIEDLANKGYEEVNFLGPCDLNACRTSANGAIFMTGHKFAATSLATGNNTTGCVCVNRRNGMFQYLW